MLRLPTLITGRGYASDGSKARSKHLFLSQAAQPYRIPKGNRSNLSISIRFNYTRTAFPERGILSLSETIIWRFILGFRKKVVG